MITNFAVPTLDSHLFLMGIGVNAMPSPQDSDDFVDYVGGSWFGYGRAVMSSEFVAPDHLPAHIERLVLRDLLPLVEGYAKEGNPVPVITQHTRLKASSTTPGAVEAFLQTPDGLAIAGRYILPGGAEAWCIPSGCDLHSWISRGIGVLA